MMCAQLIIMDGPDSGRHFELEVVNNIGTNEICNIRLMSPNIDYVVSIKKKSNWFMISCPGASGGKTLVNGQPVYRERRLKHGDMITLSDTMLLFGEELSSSALMNTHNASEPMITSTQSLHDLKSLKEELQNLPMSYVGIVQQIEEIIFRHLKQEPVNVQAALQEVIEVLIRNNIGDRGTIFLKEGSKLWPIASASYKKFR
ncbi:FHA domain-containing protein [Candidatus Uabimicrobium amorphum]|uniref:FHA domain-containing protein n=1 Tax=Uabimicrobium amorphum TaxID=2596890 RepID=A0A5S9ISL2_UABAM|nr:FHA domain-containing protein [Candidatus Uabimicrobium amorphum]BBM86781.1 hypothetical protein UABAM_05169 [Candidatus Uabimicrobium amorphum]